MKKDTTIADLIENRYGSPTKTGAKMLAEGELATILNHRTHRRFTEVPVPDEILDILLAAAFSAPAKSDLQQASVVVIKDKIKRKAIADLLPAMPWIATCPVLMLSLIHISEPTRPY